GKEPRSPAIPSTAARPGPSWPRWPPRSARRPSPMAEPIPVPGAWAGLPFFRQDWPAIAARLRDRDWLPGPARVFAALELTPPEQVRVVILGQDPYPTPGHATGLAFSVTPETALPRSLRNIYAEMREDIGAAPPNGDLSHWARQGVLLL